MWDEAERLKSSEGKIIQNDETHFKFVAKMFKQNKKWQKTYESKAF